MPILEVLGSGCTKCKLLAERTDAAAKSLGIDYTLLKVTEYSEIMAKGVMSTPALVVDGVVKVVGKVPALDELKALLS